MPLHHSVAFEHDELWRYAAYFKTNAGKQLGIKLSAALAWRRQRFEVGRFDGSTAWVWGRSAGGRGC